jgi:hypothetical protein
MKLPPILVRLRIRPAGRRGFGLWLPVVLLWPLALPLVLLALLLCAIADLLTAGRFRLAGIWLATCLLLCELRGLRVRVHGRESGDDIHIAVV